MADIIEDICPYPLPTHHLIQHYSIKIFLRSWLVFCQERKPWTLKILNCDQSQQTKLAARKQATKLLPLLNAALSFPLLIGFFLATQSHSRNIFVVYGFTSFTINPPQSLLFSLGSEIVWIDGTKCIAIRRKDVD